MSRKEYWLLIIIALYLRHKRRLRRYQRSTWVRSIYQKRRQQGDYHNLLQEIRLRDPESHFRGLRMSKETFDRLLAKVGPILQTRNYFCAERPAISPAERLSLTLRFLASGDSQVSSMLFNFRIGRSTVCGIVKDTCKALWTVLQPEYVSAPSTKDEWIDISRQFELLWNFPNCIGAIDGKHVVIQAPANYGSYFYNYKGSHSIVLMAVVDAQYKFVCVDVGDAGRHNDSGIFATSIFGQALTDERLNIPEDNLLPGSTMRLPYVIVGDEGFPLRHNLLRPYPGRNLNEKKLTYNYRLSRARRIVENSFGILASRWRIFRRPIIAHPDNAVSYTKAAIALHNYLRTEEDTLYCPPGYVDGEDGSGNIIRGMWKEDGSPGALQPVGSIGGNRCSRSATEIRDSFANYFSSSVGEVSWQYRHVQRTS